MIRNLQALRGVAAILIFYHHFGFSNVFTDSFGDFGVAFFMMLSGFVLSLAASRKSGIHPDAHESFSINAFMRSRLLKIYPLYFICWAMAVLILPYRGSRPGICLSMLMLQSWVPEKEIYFAGNSVAWFISDLMFCYLVFAILRKFSGRLSHTTVSVGTAVYFLLYLIIVLRIPSDLVHGIIYINPIMQLSSFIIGILLYHLYSHLEKASWIDMRSAGISTTAVTLAETAVISIVCIAMNYYGDISTRFTFGSYWWLPIALCILLFSVSDRHPGVTGRILHQQWIQKMGDISFSFYLLHMLGIYCWKELLLPHIPAMESIPLMLQSVIVVALLIMVAIPVHRYLEKPFLNTSSRRTQN